jgi:3-phosphoshikimate 1-carboxyvinyltransferase
MSGNDHANLLFIVSIAWIVASESLLIKPLDQPFDVTLHVPGSKSITNRALLIAALASGTTTLRNVLFSEDTRYMIEALEKLGIPISKDEQDCMAVIEGREGRIENPGGPINVGNSGTCMRFLTTALVLGEGEFVLDGNERMRQRPIQDLIDGLHELGVEVESIEGNGCPPIRIDALGLPGGITTIKGDVSSQYVSSALLSAPYARSPMTVAVAGKLVSRPYVTMTTRMMEEFGVEVRLAGEDRFEVPNDHPYAGREYFIESDYTGASYFMAAAALTGSRIELTHLPEDSLQGDAVFGYLLSQMGARVITTGTSVVVEGGEVLEGIEADMFDCSDLVPTVAVLGAFARGATRIRNVENIRVKESDRIIAVATELRKLGVSVEEYQDGLEVEGGCDLQGAEIDTYDDHRIAMAFSLAGLKTSGISINNPSCVSKTFPEYWSLFTKLQQ